MATKTVTTNKEKKGLATAKPSGTSITQNGMSFTANWKTPEFANQNDKVHGDNPSQRQAAATYYAGGIEVEYRLKYTTGWGGWHSAGKVPVKATSKHLGEWPRAKLHPFNAKPPAPYTKKQVNYFMGIQFRVRGKRGNFVSTVTKEETKKGNTTKYVTNTTYKFDMSAWETSKQFNILVPYTPKLSVALDSEANNVSTFSWSVNTSNSTHREFTKCEIQTMRKTNYSGDIKKAGWSKLPQGALVGSTGSKTYKEEYYTPGASNKTVSYTRLFRIRARGPSGNSPWVYKSHVYATPYRAKGVKASVATNDGGRGITVYVNWVANQGGTSHPIDKAVVQYCITVPAVSGDTIVCPYDHESSVGWTDAFTVKDTLNRDNASFMIDRKIPEDNVLFVRVNTVHDRQTTYGIPTRATGQSSQLKDPTLSTIDDSGEPYESGDYDRKVALATVTNNSDVEGSYVMIYKGIITKENWDKGVRNYSYSAVAKINAGPGETVSNYQFFHWVSASTTRVRWIARTFAGGTAESSDHTTYKNPTTDRYWKWTKYTVSGTQMNSGSAVQLLNEVQPINDFTLTSPRQGTVKVSWSFPLNNGYDETIVSWSDDEHAWESTTEPSTHTVRNISNGVLYVNDLAEGSTWYFRLRGVNISDEAEVISPWSNVKSIELSSPPEIAPLSLSTGVAVPDSSVTATWEYTSTDETPQVSADIRLATLTNEGFNVEGTESLIKKIGSSKKVLLDTKSLGWTAGNTYHLTLSVQSQSKQWSEWCQPVPLSIAEPLNATMTCPSLVSETVINDPEAEIVPVVEPETEIEEDVIESGTTIDGEQDELPTTTNYLEDMPLTVRVTGGGENATVSIRVERAEPYISIRPDDDIFSGFENEVVYAYSHTGEDDFVITNDMLVGRLDDGAKYRITCRVEDSVGQVLIPDPIHFTVRWAHQAVLPSGTCTIDKDNLIAKIIPSINMDEVPTGWDVEEGDCVDIYRLSVDKAELIVENGSFGTTYVDPYPAIGQFGGHRIVFKTANGDYITNKDNGDGSFAKTYAWIDLDQEDGDYLETEYTIIDFGTESVRILYNIDLSNNWSKDFKETKYLGGSIQGDWNPAVSRTGSVNTVSVLTMDQETIKGMRKLAAYSGICHIRTRDGSSYACDVQVSDSMGYESFELVSYSLNITKVDSQSVDGMTLEEWEDLHNDTNIEEG